MGLHWVYNQDQIGNMMERQKRTVPEFFEPPSSPFYQYESGSFSPYGDEALPVLQSVVTRTGVDGEAVAQDLAAAFKRYHGWLNSASKGMMANVLDLGKHYPHTGVDDNQAHSLVKVPIIVARYAGHSELISKVEEAIRAHQNNQEAVDFGVAFAVILEGIVQGRPIADAAAALQQSSRVAAAVKQSANHAMSHQYDSPSNAVSRYGQSCHLPGSFQGPLYIARQPGASFTSAVRASILAGGDSTSRSMVVGAMLAAQDGMNAIPSEWMRKTTRLTDVAPLVEQLLQQRDVAA